MALVTAVNKLGFALFRLLASRPGENLLIAPPSLTACLSMVTAGSTEGSRTEEELLSLLGGSIPSLPTNSALKTDNSAWVRMRIRPDFVEAVQERFGAEAHELAGTDPEPINEWVKDKTLARIPTLFDSPLDPMTAMVLVNTVFFKGSWVTVFDVARTRRSEFRNFSSRLPCDMMYKKDRMMYMENDQLQAVRLPYSDEKTWATIILPKMEGPAEVASTLEQTWEDLNWELRGRTVELRLPRFRLSAGGSMKSALRQLGLKETLEPRGGFLKMSDDLSVHLSEVMHKATLEVNEEGTVAAAASGAVMKAKSIAPKPPVAMTVDRPFLFILSDGLGSVHFLGQIVVPELAGLEATLSEL